jgi:thymidylate synthase ThyX
MKELNELKEKINSIIEQSNTDKPACKNCKRYCDGTCLNESHRVKVTTPDYFCGNFDVKYNISENTKDNLRVLLSDVERINEDVTNLLPLAYQSKMVWKVNLRTLINFMNKRLCTRAYWEIREASLELKKLLSEYSDEWKKITDMLFVPTCEKYKFINKDFCFCTETKCCNRHPHISKLKIVSIDSEDDGR